MLTKAGEVKQANELATALEKIQTEVAGSYGLDGKIDFNELNKNLKTIIGLKYNDEEIVLDGENKNIIEELPAEVNLDNNSFFIDENGKVLDWKKADVINDKIGDTVQGYLAANLEWQVYYSDPVETFLISKKFAKNNYIIPLTKSKQSESEEEYEYMGSQDVKKLKYGSRWNKMWLKKCTENNSGCTRNHAKATAYMCDPINWTEYKTEVANYAVGGPTIELFIASWNKSQKNNKKLLDSDVTFEGYRYDGIDGFFQEGIFKKDIRNGVYGVDRWASYWFASPCLGYTWGAYGCLFYLGVNSDYYGYLDFVYYNDNRRSIRPIVSIPTSKISINKDIVTVNP